MTNFRIQENLVFTPEETAAVAALEQLCNDAENMNLRIGTESFSDRPGDQPFDFLYYENGQLLGYLCWFTLDGKEAEIMGMVHPDHRRRGIFTKLMQAADQEMRRQGIESLLYVINAKSRSGLSFITHFGAEYRNAEYSMTLQDFHPPTTRHDALRLRTATAADFEFMVECSSQAFGDPADWTRDLLTRTAGPKRTAYIAERDGTKIAMVRVLRSEAAIADIHGFAVLPAFQGHGYGRQILADTVQLLLQEGRTEVNLDVVTENERALRLYESVGFAVNSAFRYYAR